MGRGEYTRKAAGFALIAPEPAGCDQTFEDSVLKVSSAVVARIPRRLCEIVLPRIPWGPAGNPLRCSAILVAHPGDIGSCPDRPRKNPATDPFHCLCVARYFAAPTCQDQIVAGDAPAAPRF